MAHVLPNNTVNRPVVFLPLPSLLKKGMGILLTKLSNTLFPSTAINGNENYRALVEPGVPSMLSNFPK